MVSCGPRSCTARRVAAAVVALVALVGACRGPDLAIDAPGPRYLDGRALTTASRPFEYYGTVSVLALPVDTDERPDWSRVPTRTEVVVPAPAPGWMFPFDFVVELLGRAAGVRNQHLAVTLDPPAETVVQGFQPDLQPLRERAHRARLQR